MKKSSLKVITVVGTRPEIIRLSRVISLLEKSVEHILVHTGQNYDYELNQIFFQDLGLRDPDYYLAIDTTSLGKVLGETLIKCEEIFLKERPDAVLILGDTNASVAGIIAKRMRIPIYHMEAGNRCFDLNVPEETNRRIIDHTADFNLVYTEHARRHLLSEGLPHRHIYLTGSPMYEVIKHYEDKIKTSAILPALKLTPKEYFLVSAHREENVDNSDNLKKIIAILNTLALQYQKKVIVSTHPRTRKRIEALRELEINPLVSFLKPFGFTDYVHLQMNSLCTVSDSGTISEEAAILSFPAVTIRNALERPEALDAGSIVLTGLNPQIVLDAVGLVMAEQTERKVKSVPCEYLVGDTSWRVAKLILGTAKLTNRFNGIDEGLLKRR